MTLGRSGMCIFRLPLRNGLRKIGSVAAPFRLKDLYIELRTQVTVRLKPRETLRCRRQLDTGTSSLINKPRPTYKDIRSANKPLYVKPTCHSPQKTLSLQAQALPIQQPRHTSYCSYKHHSRLGDASFHAVRSETSILLGAYKSNLSYS